MKVRIKKLTEDAVIPSYAKEGDAGLDLTATKVEWDNGILTAHTGLAIEIPEGHVGLLYSRSSIYKYEMALANAVGVVDSGYRGEIMLKFRDTDWQKKGGDTYKAGEKVGQIVIMPYPHIELEEVAELSDSQRGVGGYGSSGR